MAVKESRQARITSTVKVNFKTTKGVFAQVYESLLKQMLQDLDALFFFFADQFLTSQRKKDNAVTRSDRAAELKPSSS